MKTALVLLCLLVVVYGSEDNSLKQHKDLIVEKVQVGLGIFDVLIDNVVSVFDFLVKNLEIVCDFLVTNVVNVWANDIQVVMGVINHFIGNILEKDSIKTLCTKFAEWILGNILNAIFAQL